MVAHFAHHLVTAIPVPLMPLIRSEFGLDYTQSGLMVSAFSLSYGVGQLPAGWLADRIGPRILMTIGICGVALSGLFIGFSRIYSVMLVLLAMMGIMGGGYHPAAPPIISALVEPNKRGRFLGLHMIGGSASFFLAPIIATAIAMSWGWRGSFIALAIPAFLFGIVLCVVLGGKPHKKTAEPKEINGDREAPRRIGRMSRLITFIALNTCTAAVFVSIISFIPLYMVDHFGVSEKKAGAFLGLIYSAGLWVSPLGGYLSDRMGRVRVMLAICFMAGPILYMLNLVPYGWGIYVLFIAMGTIIYIRMPVSESYIVEKTAPHHRSTILGIYYFSAMEAGGVLTPGMGYLIDRLGFYLSFTIAGAFLILVTLVCSILLRDDND